MNISKNSAVKAPAVYKVSMTVNGVEKAIKAGSYKGSIVLTVSSE